MARELLDRAERALSRGEPGRAAALADRALAEGGSKRDVFRIMARATLEVLVRTGLVTPELEPGPSPPRLFREGAHASSMRELVSSFQRALYGLAAERESHAFSEIFRLGHSLMDLDVVRAPRTGEASGIVVSMLCCERPDLMRRTIGDLLASDLPPADIVFFEDASGDARVLPELAGLDGGPHRIHVVANRGFSTRSWPANQNTVLDYVEREIGGFELFATCDADMALHPRWWSAIESLYEGLRGRRLPEGRLGVLTAFHAEQSHPTRRTARVDGIEFRIKESIGGCQLVVPRDVYANLLGPFDHLSDWGWSSRLRAAGRFVAATVPSHCQHLGESSLLFHTVPDRAPDFEAG